MSLVKPDEYGEWADGGAALVVAPTTLQKQTGWASSQKPPSQILNWKGLRDYQWSRFHEEVRHLREDFMWADDGTTYTASQLPVTGYAPATLTITDPSSSIVLVGAGSGVTPMMSRALKLTPPTVAGQLANYSTTAKLVGFGAGSGATISHFYSHLRIATWFQSVPAGANQFYHVGFNKARGWAPSGNGTFGLTGLGIQWFPGSAAHWRFVNGTGGSVVLGAGQDPVAQTWQFWDIEWFGVSTAQGIAQGAAFGRLSLNGAVVASLNGQPANTDGNLYVMANVNTDTGSGGPAMAISGYVTRWSVDV